MAIQFGANSLWQCASPSCGLLNYNTVSSRCKACFGTKRIEFAEDGQLTLWYNLLDQCLDRLMAFIANDWISCTHMMAAFPFYQSKIHGNYLSDSIKKISLKNLPEYAIDPTASSYGYTNIDATWQVDEYKEYTPMQLKLALLHLDRLNMVVNDKECPVNNDWDQKNVMIGSSSLSDTESGETYDFFKIDGLNYATFLEKAKNNIDQEAEKVRKLIMVALFKDDKQALYDLKCYGVKCAGSATMMIIKNENTRKVFVYRQQRKVIAYYH